MLFIGFPTMYVLRERESEKVAGTEINKKQQRQRKYVGDSNKCFPRHGVYLETSL